MPENTDDRGFFWGEVTSAVPLSTNLIRITFGGQDLRRYVPADAADECVTLYFPAPGEKRPPAMTEIDGNWWYYDDDTRPEGRNYTVRRIESDGSLVIDFVAHEGGVAASWAMSAAVGDVLVVTPPRSWYDPPADTEWRLLVADLTGLPALGRILDELPAGARVHAIVEVFDASDKQNFSCGPNVTVQWCVGTGNGHGPSALPNAVRAWDFPEGNGYVWFAGEAADSRAVRKFVRRERGIVPDRFEIIGYWRVRAEQWMAEYEKVEDVVTAAYRQALEEGKSEKEAAEAFDEQLEKAGL